MQLLVQPVEALMASEGSKEDVISDPEEDSIAGQMAAMRGQSVKRIDDDDDDESDSEFDEESDEDRAGTTSESEVES